MRNDVYIGTGDYSSLLGTGYDKIDISPKSDGSYALESASFGAASAATNTTGKGFVPTEGYFAPLGYTN